MLRYKYIYQISLIIFLAISTKTYSQQETVWFDGAARSFFTRDFLDKDINLVETTPRNISNGYNLLDLNTHINPIDDLKFSHSFVLEIRLAISLAQVPQLM